MIFNIKKYLLKTKYNIGFVENDIKSIVQGEPIRVKWIKHNYRDRWFADPFILDVNDKEIIVLVEEWYDPIKRGRISRLVIDKHSLKIKELKTMLELGTHLSFPAFEKVGNDIYIHPENSAQNCHKSYKYNSRLDIFEESCVICNKPLVDSVFTDYFGDRLLFSTELPDANTTSLNIYTKDTNSNLYHYKENILFKENIARMAGNFFMVEGEVYRPSQVCIKSYGDAVSIQKVSFDNGKWAFKEIRRIYSPSKKYQLGFHTFNLYKETIVVDALGYKYNNLLSFLRFLKLKS